MKEMKTHKNIIILLIGVSIGLFITAIVLMIALPKSSSKLTNKTDTSEKDSQGKSNNVVEEDNTNTNNNDNNTSGSSNDNSTSSGSNSNSTTDSDKSSSVNNNTSTSNSTNNSNNSSSSGSSGSNPSSGSGSSSSFKGEDEVISYFESSSTELDTFNNEDNTSFKEKAKNTFVSIVDFIFYDKEIKGYTFKGLTTSAKLKIINIALTIDSKIDKYFPNYKENIKDKYTDIKGKLALKYLEITASLCESVGEATCNQAKEDFSNMKKSFSFTWDLLKELAKSGSSKVKEMYESIR